MDATRFDSLTRMLATRDGTRRALLRRLAGLPLGGALAMVLGFLPANADPGDPGKGSSHRRRRRKTRHKHRRNRVRRKKQNKPNKRNKPKPTCTAPCPVCQTCNDAGQCAGDPGQNHTVVCAGMLPNTSVCCNGECCTGCCGTDGSCGACLVFTSSSQHNGDLDGLAGADAICQSLAAAANLPGAYMAWLSTFDGVSVVSPATRFRRSQQPYQRVDGVVVANDWADLTDGNLANPISKTEQNQTRDQQVWTSTLADGATVTADDCFDWTSDTVGFGRYGRSTSTGSFWTSDLNEPCDDAAQGLYCFQQS